MDIRKVKKLIEMMQESDLGEIEIKEGEDSVRISRTSKESATSIIASAPQYVVSDTAQATQASVSGPGHATVTAPMVGTFYHAPDPDAAPFVTKGAQIKQGDTLCIIESMKMMNRITSEYTGMLEEVLVENASGVEYDQPLFVIKSAS